MSLREQIVTLESLANIDAELRRLDEQITQDTNTLAALKAEQKKLEEKLGADRASVADMDKVRSELVAESRQMATQLDRSREKLGRTRNEREANAAQREVEEVRKLQRDREDEIQKISTLADSARKSIGETEAQLQKVLAELGEKEDAISSKVGSVTAERDRKAAERAGIAKKVAPMTLRRYEQVRQRKGTAIAKTTDGTCQACHMSVPPMLFQKLMRGEAFDQCPSCNRILYYQPPVAASESEGASR